MERQHGVASYNKGCGCGGCREAKVGKARRLRAMRYSTREYVEGMVMCIFCLCWFDPKGIRRHEEKCGT